MAIDLSPVSKLQLQTVPEREHSLFSKDEGSRLLVGYLLACKVEDKSPLTLAGCRQRLTAFIGFIRRSNQGVHIAQISASDIRLFLLFLKERGVSPVIINVYYRVLPTFFNWLINEGQLEQSPLRNIKAPRKLQKARLRHLLMLRDDCPCL